jgi:hypothetical protein
MLKLDSRVASGIASRVGMSIEEIRYRNPVEIAQAIEKKQGKKLSFSSELPFVGRGNVLRDGVITSAEIDREIDRILGA